MNCIWRCIFSARPLLNAIVWSLCAWLDLFVRFRCANIIDHAKCGNSPDSLCYIVVIFAYFQFDILFFWRQHDRTQRNANRCIESSRRWPLSLTTQRERSSRHIALHFYIERIWFNHILYKNIKWTFLALLYNLRTVQSYVADSGYSGLLAYKTFVRVLKGVTWHPHTNEDIKIGDRLLYLESWERLHKFQPNLISAYLKCHQNFGKGAWHLFSKCQTSHKLSSLQRYKNKFTFSLFITEEWLHRPQPHVRVYRVFRLSCRFFMLC